MPVYRDDERRTWYVTLRYKDGEGRVRQKKKRGFKTKREALKWEREFSNKNKDGPDMKLRDFIVLYQDETKPRLKYNTWLTKEYVFKSKVVPYLGEYMLSEITAREIIRWQNALMEEKGRGEGGYSPAYLRTIHQDLSAVFNYAVRYYDLPYNPVKKAGPMGGGPEKEMRFWTKEEYLRFSEALRKSRGSRGSLLEAYYAFELLYWCGIRVGELLALTWEDFDFTSGTLSINKSYQRLQGKDYITEPKTVKSKRKVIMPGFLADEMREMHIECLKLQVEVGPRDRRIFNLNKVKLARIMKRGSEKAGVVPIRIHDLRHSHISLLIDMGFTPLAIADRVGHESERITYRYAHLFPNRQREIAEKLDKARRE